jgi:hypothetical protein
VECGPLFVYPRKGDFIGSQVTAFSDLSNKEVPEDQLGRLVVKSHPDLDGQPVYLETLPEEVADLDKLNLQVVTVEWQPPGEGEPQSFILSVQDFADLAQGGNMADLLANAPAAKTSRRSGGGGEINYATLEHAGRPHRGKISPEEAAFVREHLAEVNARLAQEGERLIDPTNPEHKEKYGF